jgi:hypothetical protein
LLRPSLPIRTYLNGWELSERPVCLNGPILLGAKKWRTRILPNIVRLMHRLS